MRKRRPAGQLRERITIQRRDEKAVDEFGNTSETWTDYIDRWGKIVERTGREQLDAGALHGTGYCTVRIRQDGETDTITTADRAELRGTTWAIRSAIQLEDRERWAELLLERGVAE